MFAVKRAEVNQDTFTVLLRFKAKRFNWFSKKNVRYCSCGKVTLFIQVTLKYYSTVSRRQGEFVFPSASFYPKYKICRVFKSSNRFKSYCLEEFKSANETYSYYCSYLNLNSNLKTELAIQRDSILLSSKRNTLSKYFNRPYKNKRP